MSHKIFNNAWGASKSSLVLKLRQRGKPTVIIADSARNLELIRSELEFFNKDDTPILLFPSYDHDPYEEVRSSAEVLTARQSTLDAIRRLSDYIVVTTPYALLKKLPNKDEFYRSILTILPGDIVSQDELLAHFDKLGYLPVEVVSNVGEYRLRGGIVDFYPAGHTSPVRLEYFDDEVDAMFTYDIETQRRVKQIDSLRLLPASDIILTRDQLLSKNIPHKYYQQIENFGKYAGYHWLLHLVHDNLSTVCDYLPSICQYVSFNEDWQTLIERTLISISDNAVDTDIPAPMSSFSSLAEVQSFLATKEMITITDIITGDDDAVQHAGYSGVKSQFSFEKNNVYYALTQALNTIASMQNDGFSTVIAMESERFITLLEEFCRDHEIALKEIANIVEVKPKGLYIYRQRVSGGYIDSKEKFVLITDVDIFGFARKRGKAKHKEVFSTSISDLEVGDFVVHIDYGIGIYSGLNHMTLGGLEGDYLQISYDKNEILYVPLEQISLIQKYIGIGGSVPRVASLQSTNWNKLKTSARRQAAKIAQDLLKLYAERKVRKGFSFNSNYDLLAQFEERFEYDETEDQLATIMDIYKDMESETPMERLVCGDVGFGKTEVAMRAACKAVISGKQVMMIVPTTVLARQHYNTFRDRFKEIPVNIDYISRFRSSKEIRLIREKMANGELDIIIGTHRLLSKDIAFRDLGLLVIDEEHRFGVAHKERIAAMRSNIDVLAMTATPIPRTLQLSLSGIRDISIIETPPASRQPVSVKVISEGRDISLALKKELERDGQVFFLHNKIHDLSAVSAYVHSLAPNATIASAHGKTKPQKMEQILSDFYNGDIDILVATTIIENGIDIPNVNAIFIDNAENFGLSQLYQLKGRVGRSDRRAYCYLLVDDFASLTPLAVKRLSIIQQLSDLGSGLKIAMYDLQLRGAGDLLGAAQSGFVVKIGFELFVRMISEAIAELKEGESVASEVEIVTQHPHYIAADYIEDPKIRLDYYRQFSEIKNVDDMERLLDDLTSSYGDLKRETINLGYIMLIKYTASLSKVERVGLYPKMLRITFSPASRVQPAKLINAADEIGVKYRFAGEYEFVISFDQEDGALQKSLKLMEILKPTKDDIDSPAQRDRGLTSGDLQKSLDEREKRGSKD